ncbi:hypothetical protein [Bacillus sp. JJ722]|uniref:hypothetical protein n=1 Tax=Bacillus sp. JJ722 TaxID=3122973 RepID=UPI00300073C8
MGLRDNDNFRLDNDNDNDNDLKNRNLNIMRVFRSGNAISDICIKSDADADLDSKLKTILRGGAGGKAKK